MSYVNYMDCCAVLELGGLSSVRNQMNTLRDLTLECKMDEIRPPFVIFTQAGRGRYGYALEALIKEHNLGTVIQTEAKRNPNSGRMVRVFTWVVNHQALNNLAKAQGWSNQELW